MTQRSRALGLLVSPDRTTVLWPGRGNGSTIDRVGKRQSWLVGLGQQLSRQSEAPSGEPMESLEPSDLSTRIGMTPKGEKPAPPAIRPRSDGTAPWRKALRDS